MDEQVKFPPHRAAVPKKAPAPIGGQVLFQNESSPSVPVPLNRETRKGPGRPKGSPNKRPKGDQPAPPAGASVPHVVSLIYGLKPKELRAAVAIIEALSPLPPRHRAAIRRLMQELAE